MNVETPQISQSNQTELTRKPSKFLKNQRMIQITRYQDAEAILRNPNFQIPDLHDFLTQLSTASGQSLESTLTIVNVAPFFLEGEKHRTVRQLALKYFNNKQLECWDDFFSHQLTDLVNTLPEQQTFDLVQDVAYPLFERIARPMLGVNPEDTATFDAKASVLQQLVEPMQSLRKLKAFEQDCELLLNMLKTAPEPLPDSINGIAIPTTPLLPKLLADKAMEPNACYGFAIAMFAALAPLAQTTVNLLGQFILQQASGQTTDAINQHFDQYFDNCVLHALAPRFIHRIAFEDCTVDEQTVKKGDTVLIDIQKTVEYAADNDDNAAVNLSDHQYKLLKHLSFGAGGHFCVGAHLSKRILKQLIPLFIKKYPRLTINHVEYDDSNNIAWACKTLTVTPQ